ncbi:hypothetical protein N7448_007812 [Penicillium atrosanguineum]|uniref:Uncharacterized protein n=1 Tax=Penicillium atrosanguineum TaxID=1132637 RepID=A0A9W9QDI2_9EURO|nr:hypothetical protein N7448_007812 [Penicillium atrosanguineum]KAJ5331450.1 hypothetical protein N7476_001233 [Penicillium atrosanguineum]
MEHRTQHSAFNGLESLLKRRKTRKGTSSCWECRHRKKRCDFEPESTTCVFCLRHRLECVSQEFSETTNGYEKVGQRIDQIEGLVEQLIQQRKGKSTSAPESSMTPERSQCVQYPTLRSVNHERISRNRSLTGYLFSILPDPTLAGVILKSSKLFRAPLQMAQGQQSSSAERCPGAPEISPTAHPVLFARRLIQLALCLQHSETESSEQLKLQLKKPVNDVAQLYFTTACHLVMSQDFLISSIDGLQTLVLQARYHITIGDLRTAWLIQQRAANIAHVMGPPQFAETVGGRAESVWFELVYSDRFLSLMLGLPFAISDYYSSIPDHMNITSAQRLERIHVLLAGRIIARNMRMQQRKENTRQGTSVQEDYPETKTIDQQLKKATRLMPATWWLVPSLEKTSSDLEVAEKTAKLLVQMHQYYLLALLHQPYLIQQLERDNYSRSIGHISPDHMYSKLAATSASREAITRYLVLRNYHRSPSSRAMDEKGFTSSLTLLLAHLDGHRLGNANVLEHQRPHDLGIIQKVTDLIEDISASDKHPLDVSRAQILRRFIEVEADAADGSSYCAWKNDGNDSDGSDGLKLSIPYFGILHITRQQRQKSLGMEIPDLDYVRMSEIIPEVLVPEGSASTSRYLDNLTSAIQEIPSQETDILWLDSWIYQA